MGSWCVPQRRCLRGGQCAENACPQCSLQQLRTWGMGGPSQK